MAKNNVEKLIVYIVKSLVQSPEEVSIRSFERDNETILELKVAHDDIRLVIGKKGIVVKAMYSLLVYFSGRYDQSYRLEIVD